MRYLLDTNIISELIAKKPNMKVISFLQGLNEDDLCLSVITMGEIKFGIESLENSEKKQKLLHWLQDDLFDRFSGRIISVDVDVMLKWGQMNALLKKKGKPMPIMDAIIAAMALSKNFILVTRNEKDFRSLDIEIINPF